MKRVAITGGPPVTLSAYEGAPRGATWGPDGTIIFATTSPATGLQRVSAAGGEPTVLTKPDRERGESDHVWPEFLPGGKAVLFTITPATGDIANTQIAVLDLQTGTSKVLIRGGSHAHYVPTGHLVYGVAGTLRAAAFDLERLEVAGTPALVIEGVVTTGSGAAEVAVAANGSLVYIPGGGGVSGQLTVVSVDRQGRASPLPGLPLDSYRDVRVSPDGGRLALATLADLWIYDLARATLSRPTTDPARPQPALDARRTAHRLYVETSGLPRAVLAAGGWHRQRRAAPHACKGSHESARQWLVGRRQTAPVYRGVAATSAIGQIAIERPSDAKVLVKSDSPSAVSPDGRWMAYQNNVSGRPEIYVERYPELGSRQMISTGGGRLPLWSRDGRELFFSSLDAQQMLAVPVQSGTTLVVGRPQVLFEFAMMPIVGGSRPYDIAPDGRFLIIRGGQAEAVGGTATQVVLVQNWFEELKRLVPTK